MSRPVATVTRPRHPLQGQPLAVLGRMRRHGQDELLLVLPTGPSRWSLRPGLTWAKARARPAGAAVATLGALADLLAAASLAAGLSTKAPGTPEQAARRPPAKEDDRATCPAQSAGRTRPCCGPPPLLAQLPEAELATALGLLAGLIAKASREGVSTDE